MAYTTINKSGDYFNTVTYSGSETPQTITGVNFSADMAWFKNRTGTAAGGNIYDTVRGISDGWLYTNETATSNNSGQPQITLNSDGYVLNSGYDLINDGSSTYVSWNWKANGQGSSNTDGSINTTYTSANTTAGFSIIKYAGTGSSGTIGHGLSATPKVLIIKEIDGTESWRVWHRNAPNYSTKALSLDSTSAEFSQTNWIGTVDNSIITLGSDSSINTSGNNYICYAFAEKTGYSKFGSYTGNGNVDGSFIYTGFKPAFLIIKRTNSSANWIIRDNKRDSYNYTYKTLEANGTTVEADDSNYNRVDFISNGFKLRGGSSGSGTDTNGSGDTYIYMSFAEAPLVGTNNIPATAR